MTLTSLRFRSSRARSALVVFAAVLATISLATSGAAGAGPETSQRQIPAHPDDLAFSMLDFEPPSRDEYRHELAGGVVAYVVEDHELPLVNVSLLVRGGSYTEAAMAKPGVAGLAGSQMRAGGTASMTASEFDEELDFLAAQMRSFVGSTQAGASFNCLTKDLDTCLDLFFEMLREPRFEEERLELAKSQQLQAMQRRNDSTGAIESREWTRLMRGGDHFSSRQLTEAEVQTIGRDDLIAYHAATFHPANFIFAISGDVTAADILPRIEAALTEWPAGPTPGDVPPPPHEPTPGLYLVHKEDVNQGRITLGHVSTTRDNPDRYALQIMNDILGGGGFTSRIMSRVRSDEGLAYSAFSSYSLGTYYDGLFRAGFQSRSEAVARATAIVLEEIERIRTEPVSEQELTDSKASFIETFTRNFASAGQIAGLFAADELTGRDSGYLEEYRDRVRAVTADDVLRVAREYLHPDSVVILAVGNVEDMLAGDPEHPDTQLQGLAPGGNVVRISLPDPMTMEYPSE